MLNKLTKIITLNRVEKHLFMFIKLFEWTHLYTALKIIYIQCLRSTRKFAAVMTEI